MSRQQKNLPVLVGSKISGLSQHGLTKATKIDEAAALTVYGQTVAAETIAQIDMADTEAAETAAEFALKAEMRLLKKGLAEAGTSAAAAELVARKVNSLSTADENRFRRRFI